MEKSFINKSSLIKTLSNNTGIRENEAKMATDTAINIMRQALKNHDRIEVRGFGSFVVREYKNKIVLNPKTGALLHNQNAYKIHFKPGQILRSTLLKQK